MLINTDYIKKQATTLAEYEVQREQAQAQRNEKKYKAQLAAVSQLDSALKGLSSAVKGLKGQDKSMLINATTLSKEGMASATTAAHAKEGSYQFFVERLATRHQVALSGTGGHVGSVGTLKLEQNGSSVEVNLATLDKNSDGDVSLETLAAAINKHASNKGIQATLVRSGTEVTMVLSAEKTGEEHIIAVSVDPASSGNTLESFVNQQKDLSPGQDAIVYLGTGTNGMKLTQSTNTFDALIGGVSLTFNKVHQSGEEPLTVSIHRDRTATKDKLNEFITAINTMLSTFDTLTGAGGEKGKRGILAGDASIRSIESMLNSVLRLPFDGVTLMEFGILAGSDGKLKLDNKAFEKMLAAHPDAYEKLFSGKDNLLDTLDKKMSAYTSGNTATMKARKDNLNTLLQRVNEKYEALEIKYQNHYQRYLKQFTQLARVMASMEQTASMFGNSQ